MKKLFTKKIVIIVILVAALAGGSYFLFVRNNNSSNDQPGSNINYGPPTKEEIRAGNDQKAVNEKKEATVQNSKPSSTANLVLVDANQYFDTVEVRGYVSNIYEDGGTCTATFKQGNNTIKQSSKAARDATTTQCGSIDVPRSKFPSGGQWSVILEYSSDNASGSTPAQNITLK